MSGGIRLDYKERQCSGRPAAQMPPLQQIRNFAVNKLIYLDGVLLIQPYVAQHEWWPYLRGINNPAFEGITI